MTGNNCTVDNRSRVYRMLRNGQRPEMDTTTPNGVRDTADCETLHGQRGGNQINENTNLPLQNPPCRTQMALHQGNGGPETTHSSGYSWEGEPSGCTYQTSTNECDQQMEDGDMQRLMDEIFNEVINEEVLF